MARVSRTRWGVPVILFVILLLQACTALSGVSTRVTGTPAARTPVPSAEETLSPVNVTPQPEGAALEDTVTRVVSFFPETEYELLPDKETTLTIEFSKPMDPDSVESALIIRPEMSGSIFWEGDRVLQYVTPRLPPGSEYHAILTRDALSRDGEPLQQMRDTTLFVRDDLQITQVSPAFGESTVRTDASLRLSFNRPVVAPDCVASTLRHPDTCPDIALRIFPAILGGGGWTSQSEYVFTPLKGWQGAQGYVVTVPPGLSAFDGATLITGYVHEFTVISPSVVDINPSENSKAVPLDQSITVSFNTAMDPEATSNAIMLVDEDGALVAGTGTWSDRNAKFTFIPLDLLDPQTTYSVRVGTKARASTSMPITSPMYSSFTTVGLPAVLSVTPDAASGLGVNDPVRVTFDGRIDENTLMSHVQITSAMGMIESPYYVFDLGTDVLTINWEKSAKTEYCLSVGEGIADTYGNYLADSDFTCFTTGDLPSKFGPALSADVIYLNDIQEAYVDIDTINVGSADFELFELTPTQFTSGDYSDSTLLRSWQESFEVSSNTQTRFPVALRRLRGPLTTGYYAFSWRSEGGSGTRSVAVVDTHMLMSVMPNEALVWATDIRTSTPVTRTAVQLIDSDGLLIAGGTTDERGVARISLPANTTSTSQIVAYIGEPAGDRFGVVHTNRNQRPSEQVQSEFSANGALNSALVWTDKNAYEPGDAVMVSGLVRGFDGFQFQLPSASLEPVYEVRDVDHHVLYAKPVNLSRFGTFQDIVYLEGDLAPGRYSLELRLHPGDRYPAAQLPLTVFRPADDKHYAIALNSSRPKFYVDETATLLATITDCQDREMQNVNVNWRIYQLSSVSNADEFTLVSGASTTNDRGIAEIVVEINDVKRSQNDFTGERGWVLELVATDANQGYGLSKTVVDVLEADVHLIVDQPAIVSGTGRRIPIVIKAVGNDWLPVKGVPVTARLMACVLPYYGDDNLRCTSQAQIDQQTGNVTDETGQVTLSFTSPPAGYYRIEVEAIDGTGRTARFSDTIVVFDHQTAFQPKSDTPSDATLHLSADKALYVVGDVARLLVPTMDSGPFEALVTVDRGGLVSVYRHSFNTVNPVIDIPVLLEYAPYVNVGVALVRELGDVDRASDTAPGMFYGEIQISVSSDLPSLEIQMTTDGKYLSVDQMMTLNISVSDKTGLPVDAEVALLIQNETQYLSDSEHLPELPLSLYHAISANRGVGLSWNVDRNTTNEPVSPGQILARPDCEIAPAQYWTGTILEQENGRREIPFIVPSCAGNLYVTAIAVSEGALVGSITQQFDVTSEVLLAVDIPERLVIGDQLHLAVDVHNTSNIQQTLTAVLTATGHVQIADVTTQTVQLPGLEKVTHYWDVEIVPYDGYDSALFVTLYSSQNEIVDQRIFYVGGDSDIPVYEGQPLESPLALSGYVDNESDTDIAFIFGISDVDAKAGIELAVATNWVDVLMSDQIIDSGLPTQHMAFSDAASLLTLAARRDIAMHLRPLYGDRFAVPQSASDYEAGRILQAIYRLQLPDGGWSLDQHVSDPKVTAYVTHSLMRAKNAGLDIAPVRLARANQYLEQYVIASISMESFAREIDWSHALAFYVLSQADIALTGQIPQALYRERHNLDIAGQLLLTMAFGEIDGSDPRVTSILNELLAAAQMSDRYIYWEHSTRNSEDSPFNTSALALKVFSELRFEREITDKILSWMMNQWDTGSRTGYTVASYIDGMSVYALALSSNDPVKFSQTINTGGVSATLNDSRMHTDGIGGAGIDVVYGKPEPGMNEIQIMGGDPFAGYFYSLHTRRFATPWLMADDTANRGVWIDRNYCLYEGQANDLGNCTPVDHAANGDIIEVRLRIVNSADHNWIQITDPLPGGFVSCHRTNELLEDALVSMDHVSLTGDVQEIRQSRPTDFVVAVNYLPAGTYTVRHFIRAKYEGVFTAQPARLSTLFDQTTLAFGESAILTIPPNEGTDNFAR